LRSYNKPSETFEINVVGTANLLGSVRQLDSKCSVVVVTTDKVYENKEQHILYKEDDRLGGHDPYSASKACTELVVSSFRNSFFSAGKIETHQKGIASARAGNVIGGGDWSENRIVPDIARALMKSESIKVRNPKSVRPWQHVIEPLVGYLLLGGFMYNQPARYAKAFNFGPFPEDHLTVKELVDLAIQVWGSGEMEVTTPENQLHEATLLMLDINQAVAELNWKPRLNAKEAIRWAIEWYKTDPSQQADFTFEQIDNYLKK
jgi:CDP-glucose 4,6-dehydratase